MNWLKDKLKKKVVRRILALSIAGALTALGFSEEIAQAISGEGADLLMEAL